MTMPRILLLLILLWLLYIVIKHFIAKVKSNKTTNASSHGEKIVACSQCGLHIPESESRIINGHIHCDNPACNQSE
jgi:formylmethanofuran dehydrogenase subunit E